MKFTLIRDFCAEVYKLPIILRCNPEIWLVNGIPPIEPIDISVYSRSGTKTFTGNIIFQITH